MNLKGLSRGIHSVGFALKKNTPKILAIGGTVGAGIGFYMGCKASTKLKDTNNRAKGMIEDVKNLKELGEYQDDKDYKKELTKAYAESAVEYVKLYGPSVGIFVVSIASLLTSNNMLKKRAAALGAAYTACLTEFNNYRGNVIERFGKDMDTELRYNIKRKDVKITTIDENGNEITEVKTKNVVDHTQLSEYAIIFDRSNPDWIDSPEHLLTILHAKEKYANEKLNAEGHLFLNEVYDELGFERTKAGQVVGWLFDRNVTNKISFNIFDSAQYDAFLNGEVDFLIIEPNVDGIILDDFEGK